MMKARGKKKDREREQIEEAGREKAKAKQIEKAKEMARSWKPNKK